MTEIGEILKDDLVELLGKLGLDSADAIAEVPDEELLAIPGIGPATLAKLRTWKPPEPEVKKEEAKECVSLRYLALAEGVNVSPGDIIPPEYADEQVAKKEGAVAITNGYLTLIEFKNYKGGTGLFESDTSDDEVINDLIEGASRFIDNMTGKFFFSDTGTRYYSPIDSNVLFIDDVTTVTTLKTDDNADGTFENTWNTGQSTGDFWLMPLNASEKGIPWSWIEVNPDGDYSFTKGRRTVQIAATWGYSTPPLEIKNACYEIVNAAYGRRSGQNLTGNAEITGAGIVITPADITPFARTILSAYKRGYGWE